MNKVADKESTCRGILIRREANSDDDVLCRRVCGHVGISLASIGERRSTSCSVRRPHLGPLIRANDLPATGTRCN
jgi:hypothetical protein